MAFAARQCLLCAIALAIGAGSVCAQSSGQERVADLDNGSTIWDKACAACHGEFGQGGQGGGSDIRNSPLSLSQIMLVVSAGRNTMPAFAGFTEQELLDISTYVKSSI